MNYAKVTIERTDHWTPDMKWRWTVQMPGALSGYRKGFTWTNKGAVRKVKRIAKKMARRETEFHATRQEFTIETSGGQ